MTVLYWFGGLHTHPHSFLLSLSIAHHFAMLWASMGNTIPAAFWCLYHLITCPEALAAVRAEIVNVVGEKNMQLIFKEDIIITRQQLEQMVYLGNQHIFKQQPIMHNNTIS